MRNQGKRFVSVLLSVLIVLLSVPFVFGTAAIVDEGSCGEQLQWTLTEDGVLRVTGTGAMEDTPWLDYADEIFSAVLDEGVESICAGAFEDCIALETLDIPASVTLIEDNPLGNCCSLREIRVAEDNPNYSCDSAGALLDKAQTTLLRYPGGREEDSYTLPATVTSVESRAFYPSPALQTLVLPGGLLSLKAHALWGCYHLSALTIPDSVTTIGKNALNACFDLQSLSIGSGVSAIGDFALPRFSALQTITVSAENSAFSAVDNVLFSRDGHTLLYYPAGRMETSYTVPDGVTTIAQTAFADNTVLEQLVLPASLEEIAPGALADCSALTEICSASETAVAAASGFRSFLSEDYDVQTLLALYFAFRLWENRDAVLLEEDEIYARLSAITGEDEDELDYDLLYEAATPDQEPNALPAGLTFHAYADSAEAAFCAEHDIPWRAHDFSVVVQESTATCEADGDTVLGCADCPLTETRFVPAHGHSYGEWTSVDENDHARICVYDGAHRITGAHNWNLKKTLTPATCTTPGTAQITCSVCGATKTEPTEKDLTNHADYGTHTVNVSAATCTEAGYTGDTVCDGCGEIISAGSPIAALGHDFDEWIKDDDEQHMHTCSRCDEEEYANHVWNDGESLTAATCKVAGSVKYTCTVCGATKTEATEKDLANHADYGTHTANALAATCTEAGYTGDTVCDGCGEVISAGAPIAALGHDFDEWIKDDDERHMHTCSRCDEEEYANHVWNDGESLTAATCKVAGSVKYTCTVCGATKTETTEKDPANHADYGTHTANASAATCTEAGYTGDTVCDGCGEIISAGSPIAALGHDFDEWIKDDDEQHMHTCSRCDEEEYANHVWDNGTPVVVATCKVAGSVEYTCTVCGATKTETTEKDPTHHTDYGTHIENAVAATCTKAGYTGDTVCNGCGAVLASGEEIKALGHDFSAWTDNGENHIRACARCTETETANHVWNDGEPLTTATCKVAGSVKYTCTVCGATKTEATEKDPTNHTDYGTHAENAVAATCTKAGYTGDTMCDGCGAVLASGEEIKALGHDFGAWKDNGENHIRACTRCTETENAGHVWNDGEPVAIATCKDKGSNKFTCTVCGATKTEATEKDPTNHANYGTHTVNASAATCTEAGYTGDTVCDGCGALLASGEEIKALGHDFGAWTDNGENHVRACSRCTETETANHVWNGGEPVTIATCKEKGSVKFTCTVCGATKTEETEKDLTNHADYGTHTENASAATCTEAGYTGDTMCDGCGAVLASGEEIKALGHDFSAWTDNGENHIRACTRCTETETASHVWNNGEPVVIATCKDKGSNKFTCTVCGATKTETTEKDPANHADYGTHTANASAASCTEAGYTGDTVCDGCGTILASGEEIKALGHDFGAWTDNGENHIHACARCTETETANHVWNGGETLITATCKVAGSVKYTCTVCGATKTEATEKDPTNHTDYGTHTENAVAATCTKAGYTGDTVCDGCGALLASGEEIKALGHDFGAWTDNGENHIRACTHCTETENRAHQWGVETLVRPSTCSSEGETKAVCEVCGAVQLQTLSKAPHTDNNDDGVCDFCAMRLREEKTGGCPYCGGTHDGAFGWLVSFFHRILFSLFGAK